MIEYLVEIVVGVAALLAALAGIWKMLGFGRLKRRTGDFLDDWNGEAPRPGYAGRKSFPVRMSEVEDSVGQLKRNGGSSVADAVHTVAREIKDIKSKLQDNRETLHRLEDRHNRTDERIGDHRRRNDEQAEALRLELERRAREMQAALEERNKDLDSKLGEISDDVFRAQAARAILTELGLKLEPDELPISPDEKG